MSQLCTSGQEEDTAAMLFFSISFQLKKAPLWGLGWCYTKCDGFIGFLVEC